MQHHEAELLICEQSRTMYTHLSADNITSSTSANLRSLELHNVPKFTKQCALIQYIVAIR